MIAPDVQKRLQRAFHDEKAYRPKEEIAALLQTKSLVMFVGPAATGKTYIMNKIAKLHPAFQRVPVFTTRAARPDDDPGMFRFFPHDNEHISAILDRIEQQDVVQYAIHPTSQRIYGSETRDYPGEYNMLATLSGVVTQMKHLPFKKIYTIGLVTPGEVWKSRFTTRYPTASEEREKRLKEATVSLEWLLAQDSRVLWIHNQDNEPSKTADSIIRAILYNEREGNQHIAEDMLRVAKEIK